MILQSEFPEKFDALLPYVSQSENPEAYGNYVRLPGIWVLIGGMWIAHFYIGEQTNTSHKELWVAKA